MTSTDRAFLKQFSMVIASLVVLTIVMIILANWVGFKLPRDLNPHLETLVVERLQPAGGVYAGNTGAAQMAAAKAKAAEAAKGKVAYDGTLDGSVIYGKLCGSCHTAGVAGAPMMTRAAWDDRVAQGMETLVKHAIEGYQGSAGVMPAKGGNPNLTDEQIQATVQWMVDNLK